MNSNTSVVSPEQKEKFVRRARRLSGIVKPTTEDNKAQHYLFRPRNKSVDSEEHNRGRYHSLQKTVKTPKKQKAKSTPPSNCQDIRKFSQNLSTPQESVNAITAQTSQVLKDINNLAEMASQSEKTSDIGNMPSTALTQTSLNSQQQHDQAGDQHAEREHDNEGNQIQHDPVEALLAKDGDISNRQVLECLAELIRGQKNEALQANSRLKAMEERQTQVDNTMSTLIFDNSTNKNDVQTLQKQVEELTNKVQILEGGYVRQQAMMGELRDKVEKMDQESVKTKITFYNIDEVEGEENVMNTLIMFLRFKVKVKQVVYMLQAFRVGKKEDNKNRPITAILKTKGEKGKIFSCIKNISKLTNDRGEKYRIKDYKPQREQEKGSRQRDLQYRNKKKNTAQRIAMSVENGELLLGQQKTKYHKIVEAPATSYLLNLDEDDRKRIMKVKIDEGTRITNGKCTFHSFSLSTNSIVEVRDAYAQLRLRHGKARHIVCAYHLPGEIEPLYSDYVDDEEWGAGRRILKMMTDADLWYRAIYVVRYYGGENLGAARFDTYQQAAEAVVNKHPRNKINNQVQTPYPLDIHGQQNNIQPDNEPLTGGGLVAENIPNLDWNSYYTTKEKDGQSEVAINGLGPVKYHNKLAPFQNTPLVTEMTTAK